MVELRLLGPVEALIEGRPVALGPRQQRLVLAVLALEVNQAIPVDRLIDLIWPQRPPRTAAHAVAVCVSQLRSALAGADLELVNHGPAYLLRTEPANIDVHRFRAALDAARTAPDQRKVELLSGALELWRGAPLAGTAPEETRDRLCRWLDEARLAAQEDRVDARLRLGQHTAVIDELTMLIEAHPSRERLVAQLMLALHRGGRSGDALDLFRTTRQRLADELGLDPGPALRDLELAVLRNDPALAAPKPEPRSAVLPAQLPFAAAGFTGRTAELERLDGLLRPSGGMPIIVASGAAGIGKTALAVHWAHRVRDRFPDGQLYLDLRGYSAGPSVRPLQALAHFLRALGTPAEQIPMELDQAGALYRTLLADKRILVVLDNASTVDQVRPLLPAGTGCLAVITSRDRLGGLVAREGAHRITLDVLSPAEACDLLAGIIGAARISAEPAAAHELAATCACLPLALRIAAANLISGPERTIASYVKDLREGNRLAALAVDGDEEAAVRGAFDLSYAALKPPARELFQLLGLMPGQDIDADAAAALAGAPAAEVLTALAEAHLVQRSEPGRFTFHDLLRFYAGELARAELREPDRRAAITRLGEFYLSTSDAAARLLYPHMQRLDTGLPERAVFSDAAAANRWLETERANLVATVEHLAAQGPREVAWLLADALRGFFWLRRHGADWLTVAGAGLAAARQEDNRLGQAAAHLSLAQAHRFHTAYADAVDHFSTARTLARDAGWLAGEASALGSLGNVYRDQGLLEQSVEQHAMAREVFRRLGQRGGEAISLGNLGNVEWERGRLDDALRWYREALAGYTEVGSLTGQAFMLNGLGNVFHELGRFAEAEEHLARALAVSRAGENREGEADTLSNLGELRCSTGRATEAARLAGDALTIAREVGDRRIEADALTTLGTARHLCGQPAEAEEYHRAALRLATESGYRRGQVRALIHLATAELALGRRPDALTTARRAHDLADRLGYRRLSTQAATLTHPKTPSP